MATLFFHKALYYGYYLAVYVICAFGLFVLSDLLKSPGFKATINLSDLLAPVILGFLYWFSRIALGKLKFQHDRG